MSSLIILSRTLIFYCIIFLCGIFGVKGQIISIQDKVINHVINKENAKVIQLVDSAKIDVQKPIYQNFSLLDISLLCNNEVLTQDLLDRTKDLNQNIYHTSVFVGNPVNIKAALNKMNSDEIDDYLEYDLLSPITEASRLSIVEVIANRTPEDSIDFDIEYRNPDQKSIDYLIEKLNITFPNDQMIKALAEYTLESILELDLKNNSTDWLLKKYLVNGDLKGKLEEGDKFANLALETNNRAIFEILAKNGYAPNLDVIKINKVEDKDFLLGLMVKKQLIDLDPQGKALTINRSWKLPDTRITIPGPNENDKKFDQIVKTNAANDAVFGNTSILMQGTIVPFTLQIFDSKPAKMSRVLFDLNLKRIEHFSGWDKQFKISIPKSDTLSWGAYHTVRVKNLGTSSEGNDLGSNKLFVYREGVIIDTIYEGGESDFSRAVGRLDVYSTMDLHTAFGLKIIYAHEEHKKLPSCNIETRLNLYQKILGAMKAQKDISRGQGIVHDATTARRLYSEQLLEARAPDVVNGELRQAMKSLAEQSYFNSSFTNYVYQLILDSDVPDALDPFLSSSDQQVRQQAEKLASAIDKKDEALKILESENINNYLAKISQVKGLIYELAQYCSKEKLGKYLNDNIMSLSSGLRKSFQENSKNSLALLSVKKEDLDGKGEMILNFLSL
ncbi:MAG: hypothetical protein P0Y62_07645 [Candidatus Chryseobacterium colombiense]|nr:hypothetical protein [Chryseobacterium sp.]WEK71427.1 MAG: hypothetical protein P0Y62_07645 [Chryseobacterium sp.]